MTGALLLALLAGTLSLRELDERIERQQAQIKQTRTELQQVKSDIARLGLQEQTGLARLESCREQVAVARRLIAQLDAQLEARAEELATTTRRIAETAERIAAVKAALARRLVAMYKYGRLLPLETLLSSRSVTSLNRRLLYLRWLARVDSRTTDELAGLQAELDAQRARLTEARDELSALRLQRSFEEQELQRSLDTEAALLTRVRSEQSARLKLESEMAAAVEQAQALLDQLERQRAEQTALVENHHFVVNKGRLPWPARGKLINRFGSQVDPRYGTRTANRGIDIATSSRTRVLTIWEGTVAFADQFTGYGRMAIIDHGGGFYTLYGNLEEVLVTVGERVATSQAVGLSRDFVHFELRRQGQATDPLEWLEP